MDQTISQFWACEPALLAALVSAGRRGDADAINEITDALHERHPSKQRRRGEGGEFVPQSERLCEARGLAARS